jgi:hypothetical protein
MSPVWHSSISINSARQTLNLVSLSSISVKK